ncbi:MAG: arginine--tRNA ligase [Planctomycetota bacterium]
MKDLQQILESRLQAAMAAAFGDEYRDADPVVRPSNNPKFGDYQANLAMALGKQLGQKPRDVAEKIVASLDAEGLFSAVDIAGPGFINLTLDPAALNAAASAMADSSQLGTTPADPPRQVVIDYASPNLAKEMHIGHLRSTIIGDALARTLGFLGHRVTRQNHIGDWGTQFGMLLEHLIDQGWSPDTEQDHSISDLNTLYQDAKKRYDREPEFAERARNRVVALQAGEDASRAIWRQLIDESVRHMNDVFVRLGVLLENDDLAAESFYNDKLGAVVTDLAAAGLLHDLDGAQVAYIDGYLNREGEPLPMAVQKSDGGFGYPATDLAAVRYRVQTLEADRVIYVVDSRQKDHFGQFFALARQAGWVPDEARLDYVSFGTILGKDKKPFKTREGGTVKLADVLDEAVSRADAAIAEKNPDLPAEERQAVAQSVGIGAVKYADLSNDRIKDYVFDYDRMLALDGNTAPYLLYSYARIRSIFRKGEIEFDGFVNDKLAANDPAERALALQLLQFGDVVESVADSLEPHRLCNYLYELATRYHRFFEQCPVLKADDEATKASRLALCHLTARTLERGLGLLGINVVERM